MRGRERHGTRTARLGDKIRSVNGSSIHNGRPRRIPPASIANHLRTRLKNTDGRYLERYRPYRKAFVTKHDQDLIAALYSLVACDFATGAIGTARYINLLNAATGWIYNRKIHRDRCALVLSIKHYKPVCSLCFEFTKGATRQYNSLLLMLVQHLK